MSSVASDPSIVPLAKTPAPSRPATASEPDRAATGEFAKLLDDEPARETAPPARAKRHDAKRQDTKTEHRHETAPTNKAARKDNAPKAKSSECAPEATDAAEPVSNEAAQAETAPDVTAGEATDADMAEAKFAGDIKAALFAAPDAEIPSVTVTAPIVVSAPAPTAPVTMAVPPIVLSEGDSAMAPADAPQGDVAPSATPQIAAPTPVAPQPAGSAADAAAGEMPALFTPVTPGAMKGQQQAAAIDAPAADTPDVTPAKPADTQPEARIETPSAKPDAEVPARTTPQRAATPGDTATDPTMRPQDSAAVAKSGAELAQSLGITAPAHHTAPVQSTAAAHAAAAAAPTPAPTPAVPVAGLAVEIAAQSLAGKNRFEIRLDPPELGRIDVRLEIDSDGNVKSRLIVERAETLDMLRRDAPQLERALQQAGLKTADNALEFSLRDQTAQHRDDETGNSRGTAVVDDGLPPAEAITHNYGRLLGLGGGLDIRV